MNPFDELDEFYKRQFKGDEPGHEEKRARAIERLLDWLSHHPMLHKYEQHIKGGHSTNTLPEHALGERLYAVFTCALAARGDIEILKPRNVENLDKGGESDEHFYRRSAIGMALMLLRATVYLWSDKMEKLADAAPLPRHTVSRNVLPMPLMFWSRETRYAFHDDEAGREGNNNWIGLVHHTDQVFIVGDISYHDIQTSKLAIGVVRYGGLWPEDYGGHPDDARILKRCAFLQSPFVVTAGRRMTHTTRRQLERDHGVTREAANEPEAHVVTLRRLHVRKPADGHPSAGEGVDWKHQWWVSAHYRAQWYPSEQAHRVIWIAPYLKGPEDKPLLEKMYAVIR